MQRNSIIPSQPAAAWRGAAPSACADAQATYGCVDWYLYQSPPAPVTHSTIFAGSGFAAPCSNIIERAVAAAGAAVAGTATPSPG